MNAFNGRSRCGCNPPPCPSPCPSQPAPPCGCPPDAPSLRGNFLMQRILGCGKLHRRRQCYPLYLTGLPAQANPPFQVVDAMVSASPRWEEQPCHERNAILLRVTVPLTLRVRDDCGCFFTAESSLEEQLRIRLSCQEGEWWRGQIFVQAAVRPWGSACACQQNGCDLPLELLLEGFVLSPCTMGTSACPPPCPDSLPWYPQPRFDPYQ